MFFISDSSETSSDEDYKQTLRVQRKVIRQKSEVFSLPDEKFIKYFRLNKAAFKYVVDQLEPYMKDGIRSTFIPNILKVAATLLFLAQGSYQSNVGNDFNLGLSQSAVSASLEETLDVFENVICPCFMGFDATAEWESETKLHFLKKTGFSGVIGCVDGTHIKIVPPKKEEQNQYYNSKGFFSLNAMIICDHKMRIRYIDAQSPGSYNDTKIWNISLAKHLLQTRYDAGERNFWLLGDADYPLQPYLMTPYRSASMGSAEAVYNNKHALVRNIAERTIDVFKNRFRCLIGTRQLHYKPAKATKIINVCAALHNLCIKYHPHNTLTDNEYVVKSEIFENAQNVGALEIREQIKSSFL